MDDKIEVIRGMGFTHVPRDVIVKVTLVETFASVCMHSTDIDDEDSLSVNRCTEQHIDGWFHM